MQKSKSVIANTLVNKRGECISREALEGMVLQIKEHYLPINIEHDPRVPTTGRVSDAYLQEMDCGGYEIVAELEVFDENDTQDSISGSKSVLQKKISKDKITLHYDRNFDNSSDKENIKNILSKVSGDSGLTIKNSMDPIAVLEIVALVSFGAIGKGFLSKLGADSWEYTRDNLKSIFSRKKEGEKEKILSLSFRVVRDEIEFDVEVLATNPSGKDIDALFSEGLQELDEIVPTLYRESDSIHKMVFEYSSKGMKIKYAMNKSCYPLAPKIKGVAGKKP